MSDLDYENMLDRLVKESGMIAPYVHKWGVKVWYSEAGTIEWRDVYDADVWLDGEK